MMAEHVKLERSSDTRTGSQMKHFVVASAIAALFSVGCTGSPDSADAGTSADASNAGDGGASDDAGFDANGLDDASGRDAAADVDTGPTDPDFTPTPRPGRHDVEIVDTRQIVPSPGIPTEATIQTANNNLDVVRFQGRVYLVWRTAPSHFASDQTTMHVVSSTDEVDWDYETSYQTGRDLREPRFLPVGDQLFLYMAQLGTDPNAFEPGEEHYVVRAADGTWSDALISMNKEDYILWRSKRLDSMAYLLGYVGGSAVFTDEAPIKVEFMTTDDGVQWDPINPARRYILEGGVLETDFAFGEDGTLYGVSRNESGDEEGFGMKVCKAPASDITDWSCHPDPKKYDSPLMFSYDGEAYLIGRRNVTPSGNFDLGRTDLSMHDQFLWNQLEYIRHRKRCSIWRYDQDTDEIVFMADLPSRGDTCFAGLLKGDTDGEFVVYDYSSPLDGPDYTWRHGQLNETRIYRTVIRFTRR